jgi:hypothetical protein
MNEAQIFMKTLTRHIYICYQNLLEFLVTSSHYYGTYASCYILHAIDTLRNHQRWLLALSANKEDYTDIPEYMTHQAEGPGH